MSGLQTETGCKAPSPPRTLLKRLEAWYFDQDIPAETEVAPDDDEALDDALFERARRTVS